MSPFEIVLSVFLFLIALAIWALVYRLWAVSREVERFFFILVDEGQPLLRELEKITHNLEKISSEVEGRVTELSDSLKETTSAIEDSRSRLTQLMEEWHQVLSPDNFGLSGGVSGIFTNLYSYLTKFTSKTTTEEGRYDG